MIKKFIFIIILIFTVNIYSLPNNSFIFAPNSEFPRKDLFFSWEDIYNEQLFMTINIYDDTGDLIFNNNFKPSKIDKYLFYYKPEVDLVEGNYTAVISTNKETRYYGYRNYPLNFNFELSGKSSEFDKFTSSSVSLYRYKSFNNKVTNFNNFLFYSTSSAVSLLTAVTVLYFFNFNLYTEIFSYTFLAGSAVGLTASGYYFYKYRSNQNKYYDELILKPDKNIENKQISFLIKMDY